MSVVSIRGGRTHVADADLLAAIARDDLGALGEIYDRHHQAVRRVIQRVLCDSAEVDDLVHTTFLKLPKLASAFHGDASARAWLCGIGVRVALRHRRSVGRLLRVLDVFSRTATTSSPTAPDAALAASEELRIFDRALAKLAEKKRATFVLIEIEGMSAEDAASALEIPVATVRTRLFHAKAELREAMKRGGAW